MKVLKGVILAVISVSLLIGCNKATEVKDSKPMTADETAAVLTVKGALSLYETGQWQNIVDTYYTDDATLTSRGTKYDKAGWVKANSGNKGMGLTYKITEYSVEGDTAKVKAKFKRGSETYHLARQAGGGWKIKEETNP